MFHRVFCRDDLTDSYTNPVAISPLTTNSKNQSKFFRLRR